MANQQRRETATQTGGSEPKAVEGSVADDKATDDTKDGTAAGATNSADTTDASAETNSKPEPVKTTKSRSRAQIAREKAAAEVKARESSILESSPLWQVIYPTGISLHRPDDEELVVDVNGVDTDVEVVDEFVHVPMNGRVRAGSLDELSAFADLASQGMLRQVLETTH